MPPRPAPDFPLSGDADDDDQTSSDVVQLLLVATFNGLCHALAALARRGHFTEGEIAAMAEAMTGPLDDPDHRDDSVVTAARTTVESILAGALATSRGGHADEE